MFVGSAVSMVILQKVRNIKKLENRNVHLHKFKKYARHFQKNVYIHSFENDARLALVIHASMTRQ